MVMRASFGDYMYKFAIFTLMIFLPPISLSAEIYSCRFQDAGGFEWEKDRWILHKFKIQNLFH